MQPAVAERYALVIEAMVFSRKSDPAKHAAIKKKTRRLLVRAAEEGWPVWKFQGALKKLI